MSKPQAICRIVEGACLSHELTDGAPIAEIASKTQITPIIFEVVQWDSKL